MTKDRGLYHSCAPSHVLRLLHVTLVLSFTPGVAGAIQSDTMGRCDRRELASICWNRHAQRAVVRYGFDPARASRLYAALALAQEHAVSAVGRDEVADRTVLTPSERTAIEAASAVVLTRLTPLRPEDLAPSAGAGDEDRARRTGREAAAAVVAWFSTDGSDLALPVTPPQGRGRWRSQEARPPLRPLWGTVRPVAIADVGSLLSIPPPNIESAEFMAALEEVRRVAEMLTSADRRIALAWDDALATPTPPGHWNNIAIALIDAARLDDRAATKVLALTNVAMLDAGIACWHAKYDYWLARPNEMDARITPIIKVPNFPSYPSGHAAFSAAAAEVLAALFPNEAPTLRAMAAEAGHSRLLGGIHYRFDVDEGLRVGRSVAGEVLRSETDVESLFSFLSRRARAVSQDPGGAQ